MSAPLLAEAVEARRLSALRDRARINLTGRHARWNTQYHLRRTRRNDQGIGKRLSAIIKEIRADGYLNRNELCSVLNSAPIRARGNMQEAVESELSGCLSDKIFECYSCSGFADVDHRAGYDDGDADICDGCANNHYIYSTCMGAHILAEEAEQVYTSVRSFRNGIPDDHCTSHYGANNLWEYEGSYFDEDTYHEVSGGREEDSEEGEDEDSSASQLKQDGLHKYHCSPRKWREDNSTPLIPALGVEIEVYSRDRGDTVSSVKDAAPDDWYFESDGSLSDDYGFEIISQPYGPKEWERIAKNVLEDLNNTGAVAYTHPDTDNNYGIHINIHRRHLSPLQEARMLLFMLDRGNTQFMQCIAQRATIYGRSATQLGSYFGPDTQKPVSYIGGLIVARINNAGKLISKKPAGLGKFSPINMSENIAEIRIFQSTLHLPSFMKNLEFTWALVEWTSTKATTGMSWKHEDFVSWLGTTRGAEERYPNLFAYLRKPSYTIKNFDGRIMNTWVKLLPKQTTKSLDVVAGNTDQRLAA